MQKVFVVEYSRVDDHYRYDQEDCFKMSSILAIVGEGELLTRLLELEKIVQGGITWYDDDSDHGSHGSPNEKSTEAMGAMVEALSLGETIPGINFLKQRESLKEYLGEDVRLDYLVITPLEVPSCEEYQVFASNHQSWQAILTHFEVLGRISSQSDDDSGGSAP